MPTTQSIADAYLAELVSKKRKVQRQRHVLVSIERELRAIYNTKNNLPAHIKTSEKQELADLLHDIKITETWRGEATSKFLQYHREIQEYKSRSP